MIRGPRYFGYCERPIANNSREETGTYKTSGRSAFFAPSPRLYKMTSLSSNLNSVPFAFTSLAVLIASRIPWFTLLLPFPYGKSVNKQIIFKKPTTMIIILEGDI